MHLAEINLVVVVLCNELHVAAYLLRRSTIEVRILFENVTYRKSL